MKTNISILGRKCDLLLLLGICVLTAFITVNTVCECKKCEKKCNKPCNKKVRFASDVKGNDGKHYSQHNYF